MSSLTIEQTAKIELDKAYDRLMANSNLTKELFELLIKEGIKADEIFKESVNFSLNGEKIDTKMLAQLGIGANFFSDLSDNKGFVRSGIGLGTDVGMFVLEKSYPIIGQISLAIDIMNLIDKSPIGLNTGVFDLRQKVQNLYDKITNTTSDLPTIKNGIMSITMPDGTIYSRPITKNSPSLITGGAGNDVLFGSNVDDTLMGGSGSDLLLGGAGFDTYNTNNGDIIKDSDGNGAVYLAGSKLTGGAWNESKNAYISDDGTIYRLDGTTLSVTKLNQTIQIESFNQYNNSLGIILLDENDIIISISNQTAKEKNEKMSFSISLNRKLTKDEFINLSVNGEIIKFNQGDISQTYTYYWKDNETKNEDIKFEVSASVIETSPNLIVRDINSGIGLIKDDDRDTDDDLPETYDPLVIDLNGDGIKSTSLDYSINFDLNSDGFKESSSWISKDDAFIAIDKNANGIIDNGSELFGDKSVSNSVYAYTNPTSKNGFEALSEFDSNNDGIIDNNDAEFDKLLLWQDKNQDGISQSDEIIKLSDKVTSINLDYTKTNGTEISNATLNDSSVVNIGDMYFSVDLKKTDEIINYDEISFEIKTLPNITATGNLHSLHSAIANNETLATMMNLYLLMDSDTRKENIDTLIYEWAGCELYG